MHKALVAGGIAALLLYVNSRAASSHSTWSRSDPGGFPGGAGAGFKDLPALSPGNVFPPDPIVGPQLQPPAAAAVATASAMRSASTTSTAPILQRTLPPPSPAPAPTTVLSINSNLAQTAAAASRAGKTPVVLIAGQPYVVATPQTLFGPNARPGTATVPQIQRLSRIEQQISAGLRAAAPRPGGAGSFTP